MDLCYCFQSMRAELETLGLLQDQDLVVKVLMCLSALSHPPFHHSLPFLETCTLLSLPGWLLLQSVNSLVHVHVFSYVNIFVLSTPLLYTSACSMDMCRYRQLVVFMDALYIYKLEFTCLSGLDACSALILNKG